MGKTELQTLVTQAIKKDRAIQRLEADLKILKAQLVSEAKRREDEHQSTDGGGISWVAEGRSGEIARVVFPARKLKPSFNPAAKTFAAIRAAAGAAFSKLFATKDALVPVEDFRAVARQLLGGKAEKLIKLCESDSSPSVSFETVEKN